MAHEKKRRLSLRKRRFLRNLISNKYPTQKAAAIAAGYSPSCAGKCATLAIREARESFPEILARMGLTDEALVERYLLPLMNAEETKFFQKDGKITETADVVAWGPRREGLDMAFKLRGAYDEGKKSDAAGPSTVTIEVVDIAGSQSQAGRLSDVCAQAATCKPLRGKS
jgi:hypothetical protein